MGVENHQPEAISQSDQPNQDIDPPTRDISNGAENNIRTEGTVTTDTNLENVFQVRSSAHQCFHFWNFPSLPAVLEVC